MYIKKEDFHYMENLYRTFNDSEKKRFLQTLLSAYRIKPEEFKGKIRIVEDDIFDIQGVEEGKFITRTAIKKAYRSVKTINKT